MAHSAQILPADVKRSDALESPQSPLDEAHAFYAAAQRTARRSNLISVASLLFSACAVALSLTLGGGSPSAAAPTQRLVAERAAPKALTPDTHYVRLEELSIYRDQIVAGAIGTAELGDASVTAAKLAAGAVSYSSLADGTVALIANKVTDTRTIVGAVTLSGLKPIARGSGFSVNRKSQGEYQITFEAPFAEPPIVVAVANSYGKCYALEAEGTLQSVTLICMTDLITASPARTDMGFNFYAGVARAGERRS
jgi:hypothetical protein